MKLTQRILLGLMICAPVLVLWMVNLSPRPKALSEAWDKVQLYESHQQGWRAVPHLRLILEYQPERVELWERMAANEFAAGNYPQAVEAYRAASEIRMLSTIGLVNLGEACLQSGDPTCAKSAWLQAIAREDITIETLARQADTLRTMGELDGALQAAARWREMEPDSTRAAWLTGLLLTPHSPEDALPHLVDASEGEGAEAAAAGELLEAVSEIGAYSDQAYRLVILGQRLAVLGEWDVAREALSRAVAVNPNYAAAWALLGEVRQHLGEDGWNDLLRAKTLEPESEIVISALTLYWTRQEKYEVAVAYLHRLAAKHPEESRWQLEIGSTLAQAGDLIQAMAAYQHATEIEPENPETWRALAIFAATYGFDADTYAIPAIEKAMELAPRDPRVLDAAGWVYLVEYQFEKAEQFLQLALTEDSDFDQARLHLAQVYIGTNRYEQALPILEEVINQAEDPSLKSQAMRLLEKYFPGQ